MFCVWTVALWCITNRIARGKKLIIRKLATSTRVRFVTPAFSCLEACRVCSHLETHKSHVSILSIGSTIHQLVTTFCVDPCNPLSIPEYMERTADNPISSSFPTESSSGRLLPDQKRHAVSAVLYTLCISCQIQLFGRPIPGALMKSNNLRWSCATITSYECLFFSFNSRNDCVRSILVTCEGWITPRLMIPNFVSGSILFVSTFRVSE